MEIIISTFLMVLILSGLIHVFVAGRRYIVYNRNRIAGAQISRVFLDPLQMDVNQSEWANNCLGSGQNCTGEQTIGGVRYFPDYSIATVAGTSLRRVRLNINWNETDY